MASSRARGEQALATGLADLGAAALLIPAGSARDADLAPFVGAAHLRESFVIVPLGGKPVLGFLSAMERGEAAATGLALLAPEALGVDRLVVDGAEPDRLWSEVLERGLALAGLTPSRLALAGHLGAGVVQAACARLSAQGWSFTPGHDLARRFRQPKTAEELAEIRRAANGTCVAFREVARRLASAEVAPNRELISEGAPLTVGSLRRTIARVLAEHGLEQPDGNIVAPAEEGAMPHSAGTDARTLRAGESLVVDLYPKGTLFADCTRTFCVGSAPESLARARSAVAQALALAHAEVRAGVRGWSLQEKVCAELSARGYETPITHPGTTKGYVHGLGHGVGYELHEAPSFRKHAGAEGVLGEGDVLTLEPGLYDVEGGWAVRLEDLVVLGPDGLENLTPLPYSLDPRAW